MLQVLQLESPCARDWIGIVVHDSNGQGIQIDSADRIEDVAKLPNMQVTVSCNGFIPPTLSLSAVGVVGFFYRMRGFFLHWRIQYAFILRCIQYAFTDQHSHAFICIHYDLHSWRVAFRCIQCVMHSSRATNATRHECIWKCAWMRHLKNAPRCKCVLNASPGECISNRMQHLLNAHECGNAFTRIL